MPLPKLKNFLSVKLSLDSELQIHELLFQLWQLHPKKVSKSISETPAKWSRFGAVSETRDRSIKLCGNFVYRIDPGSWSSSVSSPCTASRLQDLPDFVFCFRREIINFGTVKTSGGSLTARSGQRGGSAISRLRVRTSPATLKTERGCINTPKMLLPCCK